MLSLVDIFAVATMAILVSYVNQVCSNMEWSSNVVISMLLFYLNYDCDQYIAGLVL